MRTKTSSITLENLNPVFIKPLQLFDLMHQGVTGEQVVITSANDGNHMRGSKHYTNDAVDIRKWYYDALTESQRRYFMVEAFEIFSLSMFDFVVERDHFHLEYEPKPIQDIPEPRIKQPSDYVVPEVPEDPPMPGKYKPPWYEFYKKNGFKRITGGLFLLTGGILSLIPATSAIGQGVLILGGFIESLGIGDAIKKKSKKKDESYKQIILGIVIWIIERYLTKNKEK